MTNVVKQSSDLQTSNFKFEFVFVFQLFDIRIQASLIKRRWLCLESGALLLQRCTVWRFLCFLPAVNSSDAPPTMCLLTPPCIPPRRSITLRFALRPWRMLYTDASYQSDRSWWPRHTADVSRQQ